MVVQLAQFTTILGVLVIGLITKQSRTINRLHIVKLFTVGILALVSASFLLDIPNFSESINYIILITILVSFLTYLFINMYVSLAKSFYSDELSNHIQKYKLYCFIDEKGKIKEISEALSNLFYSQKQDLINKDFFDVVDSAWRIRKFNNSDVTNDAVRNFYADYTLRVKEGTSDVRHFTIINKEGKTLNLSFTERPLFISGKYHARFLVADGTNNKTQFEQEEQLISKKQELDILKNKFISIIELSEECMFFKSIDNDSFWANENFVQLAGLKDSIMTISQYEKMIHPEDIHPYKQTLSKLTQNNPQYDINYRLHIKGRYLFVREIGKKVFDNDFEEELLGYVKVMSVNSFHKTNIGFLDSLQSEDDLYARVAKYYDESVMFEIVTLRITNVQQIADRHGRSVSNAFIAQYLNIVKKGLTILETDIFRKSETDFTLLLTDVNRMEVLNQLLRKEKGLLELYVELGAVCETVTVCLGKALSRNAVSPGALIKNSEKALALALKEEYKYNFASDKDVL